MKSFAKLLLCLFLVDVAQAKVITRDHIRVRLVAPKNIELKGKVQIGVHYKMDPDWHIYWKNPGDSGAAPKFAFETGVIKHTYWPYPKAIPVSSLTNYGYENESIIFLDLNIGDGEPILDLEWLVCKVDCIPGFGQFNLATDEIYLDPNLYQSFMSKVPLSSSLWDNQFKSQDSKTFTFDLHAPEDTPLNKLTKVFVFPDDGSAFLTRGMKTSLEGDQLRINAELSPNSIVSDVSRVFTIVAEHADGGVEAFEQTITPQSTPMSYLWGLVFAFIGGLILNLMPCVFPVLFLKGYSFLKDPDEKRIRRSSWIYTFGVLTSFTAIGGLLIGLKAFGHGVGWGFQLQSPYVIVFLILLFFSMGLSFLDVIKLENIIPPSLYNLGQNKYLSGDFGTGILAVVVASPCTAPFMGSALGLTLLLPPAQSLLIFLALGLGLATPIPVLAHWPWLIHKLPKSGPWLVTFKKTMSLPLFGTCAWLLWVFFQSLNTGSSHFEKQWHDFSPELVEIQRQESNVFIDFTAAWCITCQVNKKTVLNTEEIQSLFLSNEVYLIKADWTNYNEAITKTLASFQRNSVPFYVYYRKGAEKPIILSELLTKNDIYELFPNGENL